MAVDNLTATPVMLQAREGGTSMATVQDMLDDLLAGRMSLKAVASEFAKRDWPSPSKATDAQAWGVADNDVPDDDSWAAVNACSRLSPEQYVVLSAAAASKA